MGSDDLSIGAVSIDYTAVDNWSNLRRYSLSAVVKDAAGGDLATYSLLMTNIGTGTTVYNVGLTLKTVVPNISQRVVINWDTVAATSITSTSGIVELHNWLTQDSGFSGPGGGPVITYGQHGTAC